MENSRGPGNNVQSLRTENSKSAFRKLITTISEHLKQDEVARGAFIRKIPRERSTTALEMLDYMMQVGTFSHCNVGPLVKLLKEINRHDLADEQTESFLKEFPPTDELSASSQQIPHTEESGSASIPPPQSLGVQETAGEPDTFNKLTHQQPSQESNSRQETLSETAPEVSSPLTSLPLAEELSPCDPHGQRVKPLHPLIAPVKPHTLFQLGSPSEKPTAAAPLANSMGEHWQYTSGDFLQDSPRHFSTLPTENSTVPRVETKCYYACMSLPTHLPPGRSLSAGKLQSVHTTPENHPSLTGPDQCMRGSQAIGSLPPRVLSHSETCLNKIKRAPGGRRRGNESPTAEFAPRSSSFELAWSEAGAYGASEQHTESKEIDSSTQFRPRLRSRRRFFTKLVPLRDRSCSVVTWSLKRSKLNKVIYEHQREKLIKCPQKLELESAGKHPPKITLYVHPYGYENDANHYLTIRVTLDISIESNIRSSAIIRVSVRACNSATGKTLKEGYTDCSVNQRFGECMSFLSHKQLKDLECDSIEFTASAKLFVTGLTVLGTGS